MRITAIQICPVKGLRPEGVDGIRLEVGRTPPGDRIYAMETSRPSASAAIPSPNDTWRYLTLSRNPKLGELESRFDGETHRLELRAPSGSRAEGRLRDDGEREELERFIAAHMDGHIQGELRIVAQGEGETNFAYYGHAHFISLINLASIRALEEREGCAIAKERFRGNVYFEGAAPWEEFSWVGRELRLGGVACVVEEPIERCAALDVNPETGARDMSLVPALQRHFSHRNLGVYVRLLESGEVAVGEEVVPAG